MTLLRPAPALRAAPTTSNGISGAGQRVGVVYGIDRRDALISAVVDTGDKTLFVCIWSQGGEHGIDAITGLTINDENPPSGTVIRHYLGVASQPVDSAIQGHLGVADNLVSVHNGHTIALAYSVIELPDTVGFPHIAATIRGIKVYDPRTQTTAWSDNPALCLADLVESPVYGMGRMALNVAEAANFNDALVNSNRRRQLGGLSIGYEQEPARERVDLMREYAACFVVAEGAGRKLIPRKSESPIVTITNNDLNGEPTLSRGESGGEMFTGVRVNFTNTDSIPWRENSVLAVLPGVNQGTLELVEEIIDMPGTHSGEVAAREANERLNRIKHGGLDLTLPLFAEQLQRQSGDIVRVEIPEIHGDFRIMPFDSEEDAGFYTVNLSQENPLIYTDDSNFVELLPVPAVPRQDSVGEPSIGGITSGNGVYIEGGDGTIHNRIRVDLSVPPDPRNFRGYEIRFRKAGSGQPWQDGQVTGYTAHLFPVQDGVSYEFEVRTLGRINNVVSNWVAGAETVSPKNVPPGACSALDVTVNSFGQRRAAWNYGTRPVDLRGFEIQYEAGSGYIDLLTGQAGNPGYTLKQIVETGDMPAGNVTLRVRAVDTSGAASDWIYKAENFGQDPDGTWYDVDQRIEDEKNRNNDQDGRHNGHDTDIGTHNTRIGGHDSDINWQTNTKNPALDGGIGAADWKGQQGINAAGVEAGRNNTQDGDINYAKWTSIPAADAKGQQGINDAGNAQGTANTANGTANAANTTANQANGTANQALQDANYGTVNADRINASNLNLISTIYSGNGGTINAGGGDFINTSGVFRVTGGGAVYASQIYIQGTIGGSTYFRTLEQWMSDYEQWLNDQEG